MHSSTPSSNGSGMYVIGFEKALKAQASYVNDWPKCTWSLDPYTAFTLLAGSYELMESSLRAVNRGRENGFGVSVHGSKDSNRIYKGIHVNNVRPSSTTPFRLQSLLQRWPFDPFRIKRCNEPSAGPLGKKARAPCAQGLEPRAAKNSHAESETERSGPPLARSHARTFILRPRAPFPTLSSSPRPEEPLFPRSAFWGPRSSPPSPEGSEKRPRPGRKRQVATGEEPTAQQLLPERPAHPLARPPAPFTMQPASAKWDDRRDYVFIEFCVEDSKDVNVNFEKYKLTFSCLGGSDNFKHLNEIDLFHCIDPNDSKHKRTDRSILCCLRKGESGQSWPRLTKERAKLNWLSVDFNNWKDWEDDSDEDMSNFDRFSEMMNNMGGDEDVDLPEVDGADDDSQDSDDEKMPDLE
ncbi:uncharacterized protein LOC125081253 [Lutra lutra]|uniref:uncharacterized protein LOC125081253 n=1 Tax=Lutra lutra TaxID=9657 RepID=UPI001FD559C8|nr:uncharacterized protein LOC125081253 [Lutra lutra]